MPSSHQPQKIALRIVLIYLLVGCIWIIGSDALVYLIPDRNVRVILHTTKGWLFVMVTAVLLYHLVSRYINQQVKTVQELADNEKRLSLALASSHTGVWEWDLRTDRVVWSPEVYDIVGLPGFDGTFPSFTPLVHPDDLDRILANVQQALTSKEDYTDEFRIIRPDTGEIRWLKNRGKGRYDADGTPITLMGTVQDITEQKQNQNALQTSEERMKLLLHGVKIGLWDWDLQSGLAYLSTEYYEIAEYSPESVVPDLAFFRSLVHPDDFARVMAVMEAHMRNETEDSNVDFRIIAGNGTTKWISSRGKVVRRDQDGAPLRMAGTMVDVSGRRMAEDRFEQFFTIIPDLACIATVDGYFMKVNPNWGRTFGYTEQELLAVPYLEFIHPDDRKITVDMANGQAHGQAITNFVNRYRCKDGSYRWLEWTSSPTNPDGIVFATARDITERIQVEEALRLSTGRLQRIYDSGMIGIANWKIDGTIVDSNDKFLEMIGCTREEMTAGRVNWIAMTPPEYANLDQRCIDELLQTGFNRNPFEKEYERKDCTRIPVLISGAMMERDDSDGIAFILDITERKRAEALLRQSEERYRRLFEVESDAVMVIDNDTGKYIDANSAALSLYGYTLQEMCNLGPSDISAEPEKTIEAIKRKDSFVSFRYHRRKDGTVFPVELAASFFECQGRSLFVAAIRDISERVLVESQLRTSEQLYRSLFENMLNGFAYCRVIYEGDRPIDFIYLRVNEAFNRLTGLSDVVGKCITQILPGFRETGRELLEIYGRVARTGVPETYENYLGMLGDWYTISIYSPEPEHFVAVFDVITARKKAEEDLRTLNEKLRTLTEHIQLVQEQERLAIARDIHDDIGQQLTALKLDITWFSFQSGMSEGAMGERLAGMNTALDLLLARVQKIASELRPPLLDNLGLAAAIEWQVSEFTRRSGIECIVMLNEDAEPDEPQASTSVVRVVQEALTNISRHAGASEVTISLCRHNGDILLEITDNGRGIDEKEIMSVNSYGVLGMQERARLCGGVLDIDRLPQGGTRLRMTIPTGTGE